MKYVTQPNPPQHTPEDELDKILNKQWRVYHDNAELTSLSDTYYIAQLEAKQAIQSYLDTKVREAKVDENEYWHELSKIFQRGMLPVDFKDRISELTQEQTQ